VLAVAKGEGDRGRHELIEHVRIVGFSRREIDERRNPILASRQAANDEAAVRPGPDGLNPTPRAPVGLLRREDHNRKIRRRPARGIL
jgi:hypothetical protein